MAKFTTIQLSEIRPDRFDAEYFRKDYIILIEALKNTGEATTLGKMFKLINRGEKPEYSSKGIIPVLRSVNIRNLGFNNTRQEYVTESYYNSKKNGQVIINDILITSTGTGTLGRASIWYDHKQAFNVPENSYLRFPVDLNPYMVCLFLNTKFGIEQFFQHQRGSSGQLHLYPVDIKRIVFPKILFAIQDRLGNTVKRSFHLQSISKTLYQQASDLLDKELGINDIDFNCKKNYLTSFSEVIAAKRIDPEHFTPSYIKIQELLSKKEDVSSLYSILSFCARGRQPEYSNSGMTVLNSKHIRSNKVVFNDNRKAKTPENISLIIKKNDVLINGTGVGTIGRATAFLEDFNVLPDNHVTICRSEKIDPCYLSVYLNSKAGQIQVNKYLRGSSGQIELYPHDIMKFLIWVAPNDIQKEIGDFVRKAYQAEKESKLLLEQAKTEVETLIEQAANRG